MNVNQSGRSKGKIQFEFFGFEKLRFEDDDIMDKQLRQQYYVILSQ